MKSLKFDHNIIEMILSGKKNTTWRINDDKDLTVDDSFQIIDKSSQDHSQWKVVAVAIIDQVSSKRLKEINEKDYDGHEKYENKQSMLEYFQKIYGDSITENSVVKIVKFHIKVDSSKELIDNKDVNKATINLDLNRTYNLFTDGGSRGNPGPSAGAYVILDELQTLVEESGYYLGITTNNQAEYQALAKGLERSIALGIKFINVYMDSLLVVNQLKGLYKVKNRDLWPIYQNALEQSKNFKKINFTHIPRELNKQADSEVNRVLDEQ